MTPPADRARTIPPAATPPEATSDFSPSTQPGSEGTQVHRDTPAHIFSPATLPAVPGYTVSREIARGGMGVVYAAHDPVFDRAVAVKVMHTGQDAGRFIVESKITAQLPHPGVPPVYALGILPDGRPFLAMKLVQGNTLADVLRAQPASGAGRVQELLGIFEQICQTVGFAHAQGIIHRDLKPANVMVGAFGEVQVMDWGLAKDVRATGPGARCELAGAGPATTPPGATETVVGQVKGTPAYMAPEQARGEPVDTRADVFALGGILAAMLSGKPPFVAATAPAAVRMAAGGTLGDCFARLDASGADAELVALAKRCLAPDARDRFADGRAVAGAVAAYRAGVEARLRNAERDRAVSAAEAREQRKRWKVQLALAVSVLVIALGGGGVAWRQERAATERQRTAEREDDERRFQAAQARQGVRAGLTLADDLRRQYKFNAAEATLAQAAELAKGGAPELLPEIEQARADLAFVVQLDDIRYRKWVWFAEPNGKGGFNTKIAPPEYRQAFAARGFDLAADPSEIARRIATSPVKGDLVAAVDDWALYEPDAAVQNRLLEVARRADPGSWTDRLRDPVVWNDKAAVAQLAADADPVRTSSSALSVLAVLMERRGLDPAALLSAARTAHPTDFGLAFALGQWHAANSTGGQEIGPYEAARALRPENLAVWTNLGVALQDKGDVAGAIVAHREAIKNYPNDAPTHFNLGLALKEKGDLTGAIAAYREALRLDPKYAKAHNNLGNALGDNGDVEGAIAAYREAIKHHPKFALAHNNLGITLDDKGDVEGAIAAYREAIKQDPQFVKAHYNLGAILQNRGDVGGAIVAYREAIKFDPKYVKAHNNLGVALKEQGDVGGAIVAYREAIRLDPKFARAHNNLGSALFGKNDIEGAITAYREAIKFDPNYVQAHNSLGVSLKMAGNAVGAMAAYREAIRVDPKYAPAHNNLTWLLATGPAEVRSGKQAVESGEIACKLTARKNPDYIDTLAAAHAEAGDFGKAIECQKEALSFPEFEKRAGPSARARLELYTQSMPYRQPVLARAPVAPPPREVRRP